MIFRLIIPFLATGICVGLAHAATIELARKADGSAIVGVKVEGDIVPGDAHKLLAMYEKYGALAVSPVYLRSKGGDVEEAIKMGRLIRQLRLATEVPLRYNNKILSLVPADDKDNFVCGSACFLVFAGGVDREGSFLVLHRPYLSSEAARNLSDLDREVAEKQLMAQVRGYLQEMEVEPYFIEKTMWTNSQDGYITSLADVLNHHLNGIVPSIEEIVLSNCKELTSHERDELDHSADPKLREQLYDKMLAAITCENKQMEILRNKAWDRQHENQLQAKCGQMSSQEKQSLIVFFQKPPPQRSEVDKEAILPILEKENERMDCKSSLILELSLAATKRYSEAAKARDAAVNPAAQANPFDQFGPAVALPAKPFGKK